MKKLRLSHLFFWSLTICLTAVLTVSMTQAQNQALIAVGILDEQGGPIDSGARLAIQQINNAGGVQSADGNTYTFEAITAQPGEYLLDIYPNPGETFVALLGPQGSEEALIGSTQLTSFGIPVLTPATDDALLIQDPTGNLFRTRASNIQQSEGLARYFLSELALTRIAIVQLDNDTAAQAVGFGTTVSVQGGLVAPELIFANTSGLQAVVDDVVNANPDVAVIFGMPEIAANFYNTLRETGWPGRVAYAGAENPAFFQNIDADQLEGLLFVTTWPFVANDLRSEEFRLAFVSRFGRSPGPTEAASHDSVTMLAEALANGSPSELAANLPQLDSINGVQGTLRPAALGGQELSNNVAVVQFGVLGAPQIMVRYAGEFVLAPDVQGVLAGTPIPTPSPTPEGVVVTVTGEFINVRSGPGTVYDVLGRLEQGTQSRVIGASQDFAWVVVEFRGQNGWMAAYLLDVFGNVNTLPVVAAPPPPIPPTPLPGSGGGQIIVLDAPDIIIADADMDPDPVDQNEDFRVRVTVRNQGAVAAGGFSIATTFEPDDIFRAARIDSLAPGASIEVELTGELDGNDGSYSVVIVADINNEVDEGAGEGNNSDFRLSYRLTDEDDDDDDGNQDEDDDEEDTDDEDPDDDDDDENQDEDDDEEDTDDEDPDDDDDN